MKACSGWADSEQYAFLASLAVLYAEMPAGEADAERLFSIFAWILGSVPNVRKQ